VPLFTKQ